MGIEKLIEQYIENGDFELKSGYYSDKYFDVKNMLFKNSDTEVAFEKNEYGDEIGKNIIELCAEKIISEIKRIPDIFATPEGIGSLFMLFELSNHFNLQPMCVSRKNKIIGETFSKLKNRKILVLEDVITTGKTVLSCIKILENNGYKIDDIFCIVLRNFPKYEKLNNYKIHSLYEEK